MKKYFNYRVKKAIRVSNLITVESLDVSLKFSYPEEVHDFYEFAYIDSGSILCVYGAETIELRQSEFLLIPPGVRHSYQSNKALSASLFIVCFRCNSELLSILDGKMLLNREAKRIVSDIVREAKNAFTFPFHKKLKMKQTPLFGAQQLVENHIEHLLVSLVRNEMRVNDNVCFVMNSMELENNLVNDLIVLLKEQIRGRITLDEICCQTYYSKTFLNSIFKKNTGHSIIQYYNLLKIEEAKKRLRENESPSVIATNLGFESATYFTKVFKKITGMTPTAYKRTVL